MSQADRAPKTVVNDASSVPTWLLIGNPCLSPKFVLSLIMPNV